MEPTSPPTPVASPIAPVNITVPSPLPTPIQTPISPTPQINTSPTPPAGPQKPKFIIPVVVGAIVIVLLIVGFFVIRQIVRQAGQIMNSNTTLSTSKVPSKYVTDSDADGIPDALETETGLDPSVSEFTRCQPADCGAADASQAQATQNNILFIIDSSGSMGEVIGGQTKMNMAKDAIRRFLQTTASNVNIGIMVYGDKGSNAASSKSVSCASADIVAPIGSVSSSTLDGYLSQINPTGWTPIGLAIRNSENAFSGKDGQKNQIIIVTDGEETCDTDPATAATEVKSSALQIQVSVIGFAVNTSEQASLQAISTNGGGLFSVATNSDQLLSQMQASHENFEKFQVNAQCSVDAYNKAVSCLQDVQQKVSNYLKTQLATLKGNDNQELYNLQNNIYSLYSTKINDLQNQQSAAIQNSQQQLVK